MTRENRRKELKTQTILPLLSKSCATDGRDSKISFRLNSKRPARSGAFVSANLEWTRMFRDQTTAITRMLQGVRCGERQFLAL